MADFEQLYTAYHSFIYKFLLSLCRSESLAEELTQETFFRAYMNLSRLRDDNKVAAWLCCIARNLYFAWYKEQKRLSPLDEALADTAQLTDAVELKVLSAEAMHRVRQLEEPYKEVFMLAVFGQVSLTEISRLFGKSESWARVTFYRAKQKIIERMG